MKKQLSLILSLILVISIMEAQERIPASKASIIESVNNHEKNLINLSDQIWTFAETALAEHQSAKVLADYAEKSGLDVDRGIAGMPTAFIATYGSGKPIIGILGEFDALPGLSQKAEPIKSPLKPGAAGHGCGHNMFGAASLGAAIAIKELMDEGKLKGTVRFYGTPAEETIGGKLYMARAGLFDDLDVCLDWHPAEKIEANAQSSQALIDFRVSFSGKAAHAALDPWNGVSAVDALELYTTGINYLREHVKPTVRIHYLIENAGDVVNVVPENAQIWTRVRDRDRDGMYIVYERVKEIARGAAIMANVEYHIELISGMHELLVNRNGAAVLQKNLDLLGPISYTESEIDFAKRIQKVTNKKLTGLNGEIRPLRSSLPNPPGGSTDVGDVSWIAPQISLAATTAPIGTPWHSWAVVAAGGMSIGHKGLIFAAKALGMTMVDLFERPELVETIRAEFIDKKGENQYKAILPDGPPPIPASIMGGNK